MFFYILTVVTFLFQESTVLVVSEVISPLEAEEAMPFIRYRYRAQHSPSWTPPTPRGRRASFWEVGIEKSTIYHRTTPCSQNEATIVV